MDSIFEHKAMGFICIDWEENDPYITYGREADPNYRGLEVIMTPCNFIGEEFDGDDNPRIEIRD